MFRRFSVNTAVLTFFIDLGLVGLAFWLATVLRPVFQTDFIKQQPVVVYLPSWIYVVLVITWGSLALLFSLYDGRRFLRPWQEIAMLGVTTTVAVITQAGLLYFTDRGFSRFVVLLAGVLTFIFLLLHRLGHYLSRRQLLLKQPPRRLLVLGAGSNGHNFEKQILSHPNLNLTLVGFLDDDPKKQKQPEILGGLDQVATLVKELKIDDLVFTLPRTAHQRLTEVVSSLQTIPVRIWVIPDYFALTLSGAKTEEFAGIPLLDLRAPALDEYQRFTKRIFDLTLLVCALPFLLPLWGLLALLIKGDDGGPVFFKQIRMGENGRTFEMIKFRTMVVDAEQKRHLVEKTDAQGNLIHKTKNDPRVTKIGRLLRKTSLDELPQLINVWRGEMSLIGPRPELPYLVEKYEPWQRARFAVPQGLTGWWQVSGRSDKPMHLNTQDDLYYIQNYSLWLDIKILFKTVWVVLNHKGAY